LNAPAGGADYEGKNATPIICGRRSGATWMKRKPAEMVGGGTSEIWREKRGGQEEKTVIGLKRRGGIRKRIKGSAS